MTVLRHYSGGSRLPRHRHGGAYAAVVVAGGFVEAGDRGRHRLVAGKVAFHADFEAHRDDFGRGGAVVLDLPLTRCPELATGELDAVDEVVRLATRDLQAAATLLMARVQPAVLQLEDWPDALAQALATEPKLSLADWAEQTGLSPPTLSRGFRQAYGTTPKRFRAELRTQRALRTLRGYIDNSEPECASALRKSRDPRCALSPRFEVVAIASQRSTPRAPPGWTGTLASLAAEAGFVDQAHLTRAVRALTGQTQGQLRAKWVQDRGHAPG
jgi:AraC-like DNA-binding protein